MKTNLLKAYAHAGWLGLAAMALLFGSCTQEEQPYAGEQRAEGAVAQARSYYESNARPLTRTVGDEVVAIKPLPGEFTPRWEEARAAVSQDGTVSWVDVPITSTVVYTAVRRGNHQHEGGEACGHDHSPVQAVQKLSVYTAADGRRECLITTIVPEADCAVDATGFSSAEGLSGFSGFVSYHDFSGKLVRVSKYENGTKTRHVEATPGNEAAVLEVVENAVLYSAETPADASIATKAGDKCRFCKEDKCDYKNQPFNHCNVCGKEDPKDASWKSKCICYRCGTCGQRKGFCNCSKPIKPPGCYICGKMFCAHMFHDNSEPGTPNIPLITIHEGIINDMLGYLLTVETFRDMRMGCHVADQSYRSEGYEYLHGLYVYRDNMSQSAALKQMRDHFIFRMGYYVRDRSFTQLGEGLHPLLDTYLEVQLRIDMLDYYSYEFKHNIVEGHNVAPYTINSAPCVNAILFVYGELNVLEETATDEQIGGVFDRWVEKANGGLKPGL